MSKKNSDILILGFALFSMFFGAGNMVFPPYLGALSSSHFLIAILAFILTDVGLSMFGVIITARYGGNMNALCEKVSRKFALIFGTLCIISIGPLLAIPRTASTTYEISVAPILGDNIPRIVISVIFFALTLFFVLNESSIMDRVGKILTPILLVMIAIIVVKALIYPSEYANVDMQNFFLLGFNEGYQTMDALGSIFMGGIVIRALLSKGYTSEEDKYKMGLKTAVVAGIGLAVVYMGLAYAGAKLSGTGISGSRSEILINITTTLLGKAGLFALSIAMFMACLTTSIGLTATCASYFEDITNKKLSYKAISIAICTFSTVTSIMSLEKIIQFAVPILITMYPMLIVLMFLSIFDKYIKKKYIYQGAVFGAFLIGISQSLSMIFKDFLFLEEVNKFIGTLPFSTIGMPFIIPSIICAFLFYIFVDDEKANIKNNRL